MQAMTWSKWCMGLAVAAIAIGCSTVPVRQPMAVTEVTPGPTEQLKVDQFIVLGDASGSMGSEDKYPLEKVLIEALAKAIPGGNYEAGINTFGGTAQSRWLRNPSQKFDRTAIVNQAAQVRYLKGSTLLGEALNNLRFDVQRKHGRTVLLVMSDGRSESKPALAACQDLLYYHQGDLCIHTVQFGDSEAGARLLQQMADMSPCGKRWAAEGLGTRAGLEAFIREVFFQTTPDSDGDGVPDNLDKCPDTPKGVKVDKDGCPPDSDGDGVPDYLDKCPDTPKGVKVDKDGCPLDTDGDGVPDYKDECPGTPKGAKVDSRGCWVLPNIRFDTDKADIKPEFQGVLNEAVDVLKQNPDVRIRVDGHTDSRGTEAHNQNLSERRAASVMQYFVQHGIDAGRLESHGFGEAKPIVPNTSPENMAMNRRVELTVIQ